MANSTEWWAIQAKVFSRWCEQHLKKRSLSLEAAGGLLGGGFDDGQILWNLVAECTEQTPPRINKKPKFRIQKISNIATTLNFLKGQNVKLVNIAGEDILSRNQKLILGLIWTLIMKYQVETKSGSGNARSDLLNWLNSMGIPCKNFTTDWQDGTHLIALVNVVGSKSASPSGNALDDITKSMEIADKELGISAILDPSDMVSANADEKSNMTYLSFFRDLWVKTHGNETPSSEDIASVKSALRNAEKEKREKEELELEREEKEKKDEAEKKKKAEAEAEVNAQREAQNSLKQQAEEEAKKLLAEKAKKEQEEQEAARVQAEKDSAEAKVRQQEARDKAEQAEKEAALLAEAKKKEEADKIAREEKAKKAAAHRKRIQEAAAAEEALAKAKEAEEAKAQKELEDKAAKEAERMQKQREEEEEKKKMRDAAAKAQKELEEEAAKEAEQKQKQKQKEEEEERKKKEEEEEKKKEKKAAEAAAAEAALVAKERQELENQKLQAAAKAAAAAARPLSIKRVGEDGRGPAPNLPSTLVFAASDPSGGDVQLVYSLQDQNGTVLSQDIPLDEKSPGIFEASVTPPRPGKYTLTVTSPSNPDTPPELIELVVATPAEVDVKSASPLADDGNVEEGNSIECEVGRPAVVTVDIHNADPELVVVDLTDPSGNEVQCSAERDEEGEWKLRFLPTVAGAHTVIINLDGVPLTSPFTVNVLDSPDDSRATEASKKLAQAQKQLANQSGSQKQPAKKVKAGADAESKAQGKGSAERHGQDSDGGGGEGQGGGGGGEAAASPFQLVVGDLATLRFLLERVGDSVLRVQVDEPAHPELTLPDLAYQQLPDGRYDIRFTPHHAGPHIVSLLLDNLPIEGTPITLNCREGDVAAGPRIWDTTPTLTPLSAAPTTFSPAQAGDRVVVQSFKCSDFLPGPLAAIITDSSNARVPTQIVVNSATNSLDVMCWPTLAGAHKMDLKLLNEPLEGSTSDFTVIFGGDDGEEEVAASSSKKRRKKHKKELLAPTSSSSSKKKKRKSSKRSHSRSRSRDKNSDEKEKKRGSKKGGKKDKEKEKEKKEEEAKESVANASDDVKAESLFELPALHLDVSSLTPSIDGPIGVHLGGTLEEGANGAISLRFMAPRVGTYHVQIHDEDDTPLLDVPVDLVIERSGLAQQKVHVPELVSEGGLRIGLKPFSDRKGRFFETELSDIGVSVVPSKGLDVEIGTEGDAYAVTFMPTESAVFTVSMTVFGEPLLQEDLVVKTEVFKPEATITQQSLSDTLHQIGSKGLKFTLQPLSMQTGELVSWTPGDIVVDFSGASSGQGSCSRLANGKIEVIVKPVVSGEHQIQVTYKKTCPILVVPLRCNVTIRNKSPRVPAVAQGESVTTTIPEHVNIGEVDRDKLRQMRDITYQSIQSLKEASPTLPPALNANLDDVLLRITGMVEKMAPLRKSKWKKVILLSPSDFVTFFYEFVTVSVKYYEYLHNNLSLVSDPTVQVNLSNSVYRTAALTGKLFNFFQTVLTADGDRSGFEGDFAHICQSFGEIWTENIGTLTSYLSRAAARESISGIDLSQDPPTIVNALASFLNSDAAAQVSIGDVCDNYETPSSLGDSVALLPSLIQDLLRILKEKEPEFLEVTGGIVKAILFMRLGLLEHLDDSNYNDFVQILNRFNQISIDLLGYKLVRDQVQGDAALQKFSGCLSEISQFLRTVYKA